MATDILEPVSQHTFQQRELEKQKPNDENPEKTTDQKIAKPPTKKHATATKAGGRGEALRFYGAFGHIFSIYLP